MSLPCSSVIQQIKTINEFKKIIHAMVETIPKKLLACTADGTHKFPPLVVRNSENFCVRNLAKNM